MHRQDWNPNEWASCGGIWGTVQASQGNSLESRAWLTLWELKWGLPVRLRAYALPNPCRAGVDLWCPSLRKPSRLGHFAADAQKVYLYSNKCEAVPFQDVLIGCQANMKQTVTKIWPGESWRWFPNIFNVFLSYIQSCDEWQMGRNYGRQGCLLLKNKWERLEVNNYE